MSRLMDLRCDKYPSHFKALLIRMDSGWEFSLEDAYIKISGESKGLESGR